MSIIKPYDNEEESAAIGDLTIENRLDCISLYGSLEITRDKPGLALAREIKALIDAAVAVLESGPLPDQREIAPVKKVDNPFA